MFQGLYTPLEGLYIKHFLNIRPQILSNSANGQTNEQTEATFKKIISFYDREP